MSKKHINNKNPQQRQDYKNAIRSFKIPIDDTAEHVSENLKGSDELFYSYIDCNTEKREVAKLPISKRVGKCVEDNFIKIVSTILFAIGSFCLWILFSIIGVQKDVDIVKRDIEHISNQVEKIEDRNISKEILEYRLENIKRELHDWMNIDMDKIKNDVDKIKRSLEIVESK